jgi:hypothetical protein
MWLFTLDGFYSAVAAHDDPDTLVVRARVRKDAERLVARTGTGEVLETRDRDYRYRVRLPRAVWAQYVADAASGIDYDNFKDAVAHMHGRQRANDYAAVWGVMYHVQTREP